MKQTAGAGTPDAQHGRWQQGAGSVLARLQGGLEDIYRVRTRLEVDAFLIGDDARLATNPARAPREQILLRQSDDDDDQIDLGLFVADDALANLQRNDPVVRLDDENFADFCLAIEGVSHFVYLALCAADDRRVSALELELQAEIDKFACCALLLGAGPHTPQGNARELRHRLYEDVRFADDLNAEEHDRYRAANAEARRYASALDERYVALDRVPDMLAELRWFYRLGLDGKLSHIARVAA